MEKDEVEIAVAASVAVPGSLHTDGVNTPWFLTGRSLLIWNAKLALQRFLLILCGAALTILIAVQVFTRYVMGISLFGIEELASFIAVYFYFIGATHGAWERGHISASLVDLVLPQGPARSGFLIVADVITVVLCAWMSVWAWQYLAFTAKRGSMSLETGIPMVFIHGVIPVCLTLMTLYFVVELVERVHSMRKDPL